MNALANDPDVVRRATRLTRAGYHADMGRNSFLASLGYLEKTGIDRDEAERLKRDVESLARRFAREIRDKGEEGQ